jgi:hypothetical protein
MRRNRDDDVMTATVAILKHGNAIRDAQTMIITAASILCREAGPVRAAAALLLALRAIEPIGRRPAASG